MLACQEPFDTDRHDLVGFRVAAISAQPAGQGQPVQVEAAVFTGGRPWSEEPVALRWQWVEDPEEGVPEVSDGVGPAPLLVRPDGHAGWLALEAEYAGEVRRAAVRVPREDAEPASLGVLGVASLPWSVADVPAEALTLDARRAVSGDLAAERQVSPGGFVRLRVDVPERDGTVRWMATGGGSFFELEPATADWAAGDLRLDDDTVEGSREPADPGPVTVFTLWLDDSGLATAFRAHDLFVGDVPPGVWTRGRFVPGEALPRAALLRGRLLRDVDAPVGLRLVDATALDDPPASWSSAALPCREAVDGPFEPRWLLTQRCTLGALDGRIVEIEVDL